MALSRIQRAEIADDAINSAKIEDGTVLAADVIAGQITNAKISSGAGDKIASSKIAVGTVAALNVGTGANQILQFNNTPALPAVDGSLLTNLTADNLINVLPALDGSNLTGITTDFSPITNQQARLGLHIASLESLVKYDIVDQVIDNYEDATGVVAYLDSSDSRHVVTVNGSASVSTIQKKFGTDSLYFLGGTSDSVTIPSHADLGMGSGDFTIEFWMYRTGTGGSDNNDIVFDGRTGATSVHTPTIYLDGSASHSLRYFSNGGLRITGTTAIALNTWFHVAIVRSSNSIKLYLNGTQEGATYSDSNTFVATPITIGHYGAHGSLYGYQGYIDEVRMSKGIARWTANFTPPTAAYTTDSYTKLLIHGDTGSSSSATRAGSAGAYYYHGANSNMTLISESTTAESAVTKASIVLQTEDATGTVTINTDVKAGVSRDALNYVDTTLAKVSTWGSGNVYAANNVTIPGTVMTKIVTVASSKFVIDGTSQPTLTLTEGYTYKFDTSDSTNATHHFKFSTTADGTFGSGVDYTTGVTYNGTSGQAGAYTQIVVAASAPTLYYWCHHHASMGGTANTPVEAATTSMRYKVETLNQSYTAGTAQGVDHSSTGHTVTLNGTAAVSTGVVKSGLGTHSLLLDGNSDYLNVADSAEFDFGTGNYTIEFWIYPTAFADYKRPFSSSASNWHGNLIYISSAAGIGWLVGDSADWHSICSGPSSMSVNTWYHVACVRNGTTTTLYLNGVGGTSASYTGSAGDTNATAWNFGYWGHTSEYYPGNMDEMRISNVARYTANFTDFGQGGGTISSPTPFTSDSNTKFLWHGEGSAATGKVTRVHGTSLAWS